MANKFILGESDQQRVESFISEVENQLDSNNPPEVKQTFDRLIAEGITIEDAKMYLANAMSIINLISSMINKPFDTQLYIDNLYLLPYREDE